MIVLSKNIKRYTLYLECGVAQSDHLAFAMACIITVLKELHSTENVACKMVWLSLNAEPPAVAIETGCVVYQKSSIADTLFSIMRHSHKTPDLTQIVAYYNELTFDLPLLEEGEFKQRVNHYEELLLS